MTSIPNTGPISQPRAATGGPVGSGPVGGGAPLATIDPIKLLNKHKFALAGAAVAGVFLGVAGHFALARLYPVWTPSAIFEALPPVASAADATGGAVMVNELEMGRFMMTQSRLMTSDRLLRAVIEDPELTRLAPEWCKPSMERGSDGIERLNPEDALKRMRSTVSARVIPQTALIELAASHRSRLDATAIVGLVRSKYEENIRDQARVLREERTASLRTSVLSMTRDIEALQRSREQLIQRENLDALQNQQDSSRLALGQVSEELIKLNQDFDAINKQREQMEAELNSPAGITYSDALRAEVERDPVIMEIRGRIANFEASQKALLERGVSRDHREFRALEGIIAGERNNLEETRDRLLATTFNGMLDGARKSIERLQAQQARLQSEQSRLQARLADTTRLLAQINDLDDQIKALVALRTTSQADLNRLQGLAELASSTRIVVRQPERPPTEMTFPRIQFLVPAGFLLTLGLTAGVVLLREVMDQRVKGPSDITIIPRTRLVGWIPDASEDREGAGAAETAFRDRPSSGIAEAFRQVRSSMGKRLGDAGHKTVLVVPGLPGSGATSITANLALAFAASDMKVLVIDANLRRPAMHKAFGLQESPGLADVLARSKTLEQAVQATTSPNLEVLSVGSKESRVVERLSADAMTALLAEAKSRYDLVLIDTAPAIVAGDGMALAQRCDASLLIVRAMGEKRGLVARIRNELSETRGEFLGVLVNAVRAAPGGYLKGNLRAAQEYQRA